MDIFAHLNEDNGRKGLEICLESEGHDLTPASGEASFTLMDGGFDAALVHGYYHNNGLTGRILIDNIRHMNRDIPIIFYAPTPEEANLIKGRDANLTIYRNLKELREGLARIKQSAFRNRSASLKMEYSVPEFL